jgi:hypothetical protein
MTNWEDLSSKGVERLNEWFKAFPLLYEAYMVKETFRDIYTTAKTHSEALRMFNDWLNAIPPMENFSTLKATFAARKNHILNYWSYRWTNAYTESVNNAIKKIEKAGRGYKFDVLRDRCILSINNPAPDKFDYKKAVYVAKDMSRDISLMVNSIKRKMLYQIASRIEHESRMIDYIKGLRFGLTFKG